MFKHWRVYIAVTNHLSFSLFSQIWPCSWTKESLSTMVPAGEHSSSTPVFSSFRSVPSLPLHSSLKLINYSLSHLISDCQKRPQLLSFPKTNECFREGSFSRQSSVSSSLPCRLHASPLIPSLRAEIFLLMLEILYVARSRLLQTVITTNVTLMGLWLAYTYAQYLRVLHLF